MRTFFTTLTLSVFYFISCDNNTDKEIPKMIDTIPKIEKQQHQTNDERKDSLRNPSSYYFLTDYPLRKCGELILNDSINSSDNQITFNCMDSISSINKQTRDFFFPVFLKIISKSDGALSEAVGSYVMKYVENHTKEFAERSKSISDSSFKSMAYFAAYEVGYQYEERPEKWTNLILDKCKKCDSTLLSRLKLFNKTVLETVELDKEPE